MARWVAFNYREFYDLPRAIVVHDGSRIIFFDCPFNESLDDYPPKYEVYLMPNLPKKVWASSWEHLAQQAIHRLGSVPVASVRFDSTWRYKIDLDILQELQIGE